MLALAMSTKPNNRINNYIVSRLDLSYNASSNDRTLSNDSSDFPNSFRSSNDSIFTLDQEEFLSTSVESLKTIECASKEIPISPKKRTRAREINVDETYVKSPTPTKYYELLEQNRKIIDEFQ
jgi:hypothetical protein|uniref:Uncharacterized protein n=1 Tax=viral metagenome TaxID=1070528 RepID=A0A6C0IJ04_9ZZZZ